MSSKIDSRLQGTWRSNKDETVSAWRRDSVFPARLIDRFESDVLGKMSVSYAGRSVTSTTGTKWTEVSAYIIADSGDDFVVFDQFSYVYGRMLRWTVRFVKNGFWISGDGILRRYTEKFDLVSRRGRRTSAPHIRRDKTKLAKPSAAIASVCGPRVSV